jgi:SOS-response transcriptional repressor LexA
VRRGLTIAQTAVYAAVAARDPWTISDVAHAVGAASLSEAERVLNALGRRGPIESDGNLGLVYAEGVSLERQGRLLRDLRDQVRDRV